MNKDYRYINVVIPKGLNKKEFNKIRVEVINKFEVMVGFDKLDVFFKSDFRFSSYNAGDSFPRYLDDYNVVIYLDRDGELSTGWIEDEEYEYEDEIWVSYKEFMELDDFNYFFDGVKLGLL